MATVTPGIVWTSGETVTPAKLNSAAAPTVVVADNEITTAKIADGNVTLAKLVTAVQQSLLPAGAVQAFAMNSAPAGWLAADGTAVSRSTYAALFSAISTTYGVGDGSTTFALPDLRGIFVRGSGSQAIDGITYNKTFAAKEGDAMQGHRHTYGGGYSTYNVAGGGSGIFGAPSTETTNDPVSDGTNGTPRTASETRPANIALLYCIKF
jgi:microcystin-dependent protein